MVKIKFTYEEQRSTGCKTGRKVAEAGKRRLLPPGLLFFNMLEKAQLGRYPSGQEHDLVVDRIHVN